MSVYSDPSINQKGVDPPVPVNPFKEARESIIDGDTGRNISHATLAKRIGCTKLSLIRLEQGTFNDPLPTVLNYFIDRGFNYLYLTDGYINFQHAMRMKNYHYFGPNLECDASSDAHPFAQLRSRVILDNGVVGANSMQVSKALCLPQSTLVRFEGDVRSQQTVPKAIINVMPTIGYSDAQITSFVECFKDWRGRFLGKNVISIEGAS
jgi:DNA-binding XRE family transcriptional regulator